MAATTQIVRTSHGLVDALFDNIDRLNNKEIDAEHARALAHTAKTIVSVAALELDFKRFQQDSGSANLSSLKIEQQK